jgi:hypothetical protein
MSSKGLSKTVIAAIIVAVLLISAVGVYFAFSGDQTADPTENTELDTTDNSTPTEPEEENENETPETETEPEEQTPETEPEEETPETETEPETQEPETTTDLSTATSMRYKVSIQPAGQAGMEYEYIVKDAGTENMKMRIEIETEYDFTIYVINGETQSAWVHTGEEWLDLSDGFATYWDMHKESWEGYQTSLQDWTGAGEYRYDAPTGDSVVIYDIEINPTLEDSLFQVIST